MATDVLGKRRTGQKQEKRKFDPGAHLPRESTLPTGRVSEMDDTFVTQRQEKVGMVCWDSAYVSSAVYMDTEERLTPNTLPYNEDLMHKVITFALLSMSIVKSKIVSGKINQKTGQP